MWLQAGVAGQRQDFFGEPKGSVQHQDGRRKREINTTEAALNKVCYFSWTTATELLSFLVN